MNILIKNADFSAVSIGQAGTVERKSLLKNVYFLGTASSRVAGIDYIIKTCILCYDVSALEGKSVKITGKVGGTFPQFARFYSADAILKNTSYTSDNVSALNDYFGSPIQTLFGEQAGGTKTIIVDVPVGAKSLCIYGSKAANECSLVELA